MKSTIVFLLIARVLSDSLQHTQNALDKSYCERPWPSLELFMPLRIRPHDRQSRENDFESFYLRTFMLFWPLQLSNVSLNVAIDEELNMTAPATHLRRSLSDVSTRIPGGVKVTSLPPSNYYRKGYDRQQLVMLWADNFTDREYVGFMDSDAAMITYIDREDLFEDGLPVVNGRSGYHPINFNDVAEWTAGTYRTLGLLEPFKCMSYFPVIVKASHLRDMRDYITKRFNATFDNVFYNNISNDRYSQFGIMCTYLFAFKRDEYKWYVHSQTPDWNGITPPPVPGQDGNISQFTPQMLLPKPRIMTHVNYRGSLTSQMRDLSKRSEMNLFLIEGICMSPPFPKHQSVCLSSNRSTIKDGYNYEMHHFDLIDYVILNNKSALISEYNKRYERLKNCSHTWNREEMKIIMTPKEKIVKMGSR